MLQVYDAERLQWEEAEATMQPDELTLFAGEQLALLSAGVTPCRTPLRAYPYPYPNPYPYPYPYPYP